MTEQMKGISRDSEATGLFRAPPGQGDLGLLIDKFLLWTHSLMASMPDGHEHSSSKF
ncbi:MAG: hypothetical protein AB8B70_09465 [Prochlorococcus sp.]